MSYQNQDRVMSKELNVLLPIHEEPDTYARRLQKNYGKLLVVCAVLAVTVIGVVGGVSMTKSKSAELSNTTPAAAAAQHMILELEGKSNDDDGVGDDFSSTCNDGKYSKRTLQLAYELPFAALFKDTKGRRKFEASSVTLSPDKTSAYAICDASWAISKFGIELAPLADKNMQIGEVNREKDEDSGYEAIFIDQNTFYVVRESILHQEDAETSLQGYHSVIEEISVGADTYNVVNQCSTEFEFEGASKGFEGAIGIRDLNNTLVVLGLCEGNHCSEQKKKKTDAGNGRVVVMRKEIGPDGTCLWKTVTKLHLPKSAAFIDYSDITISPTGKVGVTSQENSQLWIGQLLGLQENGLWDIDNLEFDELDGIVYDFPKDNECHTIYCNIEGIEWINDDMVMAVSDKMKGKGRQDFRCFEKDQRVHVFMLPE